MQTPIARARSQRNACRPRWLATLRQLGRCGAIAALAGFALSGRAFKSPSTPGQALAAFQYDPGLRVELVAAEPLVFQPCAVAWDADGHLFVAENRGYSSQRDEFHLEQLRDAPADG